MSVSCRGNEKINWMIVIKWLQLNGWHNYPLTISLILMLTLMLGSLVVVLVGAIWIMKQVRYISWSSENLPFETYASQDRNIHLFQAGESHDIKLHHQLARALLFQASSITFRIFQTNLHYRAVWLHNWVLPSNSRIEMRLCGRKLVLIGTDSLFSLWDSRERSSRVKWDY